MTESVYHDLWFEFLHSINMSSSDHKSRVGYLSALIVPKREQAFLAAAQIKRSDKSASRRGEGEQSVREGIFLGQTQYIPAARHAAPHSPLRRLTVHTSLGVRSRVSAFFSVVISIIHCLAGQLSSYIQTHEKHLIKDIQLIFPVSY